MADNITIGSIKEAVSEAVKGESKVRKAYLFGSFARGEERINSDIDISLDTERGFTLTDASGIRLNLVEKFERDVDLIAVPTTRNKLIFDSFEREKVLLYER
jgi:predicted nucleotidyltransferase